MSLCSQNRRRRSLGAATAVCAGGSVALRGASTHFGHSSLQPLWHRAFDMAAAVLIVAAIILLIVNGVGRRP